MKQPCSRSLFHIWIFTIISGSLCNVPLIGSFFFCSFSIRTHPSIAVYHSFFWETRDLTLPGAFSGLMYPTVTLSGAGVSHLLLVDPFLFPHCLKYWFFGVQSSLTGSSAKCSHLYKGSFHRQYGSIYLQRMVIALPHTCSPCGRGRFPTVKYLRWPDLPSFNG